MKSSWMIAGTHSGSGKTTLSMGIMAALTKRNLRVQSFKAGPDYIDPMFHKKVTKRPSYNLDTWMIEPDYLKYTYENAMENADVGIVEGVMGLFDGHGTTSNEGSSSHLSEVLDLPVLLVVDARGKSRSIAAEIKGYMSFEPKTKIAGVILNRLSSQRHYEYMKEIIEYYTKLSCYGYLEKTDAVKLEERHLGLVPVEEDLNFDLKIDKLVEKIEETIDLDRLIKDFQRKDNICIKPEGISKIKDIAKGKKIAIAIDEAFNFYYQSNLDLIEEAGATLIPFSPLKNKQLPKDIDGLYLGGGFPEVFANELQENVEMRKDIYERLNMGLPAFAECGGFMYLTKSIETLDKEVFDMVGFFETKSYMTKKLQRFGYAHISLKSGFEIKAHEFHHSKVEPEIKENSYYKVHKKKNGQIIKSWEDGWQEKNVLAAYAHFNFLSNTNLLQWLLDQCQENKDEKH